MENEQQIIYFNELGIKYLENNPAHSIFYLNQALLKTRCLSSPNKNKLLAMTYNNLGCYYNTHDGLKALEFFEKSAKLGHLKGSDNKSTAYAHLNIAGILSQDNQHEKALRHALKSIRYLKLCPDAKQISSILVSAYQMIGVEYYFLGQNTDSKSSLETALQLCAKYLGKHHEKHSEISLFIKTHFKTRTSVKKFRSESMQSTRNLTPHHILNRTVKSRLASFMKENPPKIEKIFFKLRPKKFSRFILKSGDITYLRKIENSAASKIQAWWKGLLCRRALQDEVLKIGLSRAEIRAKEANEEIDRIKGLLAKNSTRASQGSSSDFNDWIVCRKLSIDHISNIQFLKFK